MTPSADDLRRLTESSWSMILGLPIEDAAPTTALTNCMAGCIHITGAWEGILLILAYEELTKTLASAMFAMDPSEVGETECIDTLSELANVIGGNLKALVQQPSMLSLPSTFSALNTFQYFPQTHQQCLLNLMCEGHPLHILVLQKYGEMPLSTPTVPINLSVSQGDVAMNPTKEALHAIMESVWANVLGLTVQANPEAQHPSTHATGCIHITGAWEGVVLLQVDYTLAQRLAAAMFAMETAEVGDAEIIDAIAELANIIGGNVKALVPQPSALSLASTLQGPPSEQFFPQVVTVCMLHLLCEDAPLTLQILRKQT